jgi:hypothetical protein
MPWLPDFDNGNPGSNRNYSKGEQTVILDYKKNVGGMGGIADFGQSAEYQAVIEEIGVILDERSS